MDRMRGQEIGQRPGGIELRRRGHHRPAVHLREARPAKVARQQRHATEGASAVDDLKSYQEIADAHVAGLEKLIPVFKDLYSTMSPEQKANADALFSKYEGHEGHKKHHKSKAAKQG